MLRAFKGGFFGCLGVGTAIIAVIVVVAVIASLGGGDDDKPTVVSTPTGTAETASTGGSTDSALGTKSNPPIGTALQARGWVVKVEEVVPNATDLVLAENQFNEPPAEGRQFFMARLSVQYVGNEEPRTPALDLSFSVFGSRGVEYTDYDESCGVIPNKLDTFKELYNGGTITGNLCWSVPSDEVGTLLLRVRIGVINRSDLWFALQ